MIMKEYDMNLSEKPNKKRTAVVGISLVGVLLLVIATYAAYTRQAYQRGTARNRDTEIVSFTSNYLQLYTKGSSGNAYVAKNIVYGTDEKKKESVSFNIHVYNYANGNTSLVSQKDITYTMRIEFKNGAGNGYKVESDTTSITPDNNVCEIKKTLIGRTANEDVFTVTFPGNEIDKLQITATAIPEKAALTNNQFLAATLVPCTTASKVTFRAEGIFLDKAEGKPEQYDGFNYGISISSGAADAVLTWNAAVLEIDKFFVEKLETQNLITSKDLANGELKFKMDQSNGTGDFLISFYIKDKSKIAENWSDMEKMIQFIATQKAQ
ncbi:MULTISPECIES: hypothetical protein [Clostridia]|uniref:hypothetical protein n=1 Tax=Clostridia TaxID=186801 RepID=UPI000EB3DDDF|nr:MULTISPECIES: hypothetical protein [Clostridia]RKQ31774.1 hypothetical protein D8Q48_00455 [Ruminococcus sp. B05]TAP36013.1 hypothetical protein EYA86_00455 [Mediterraneibacter sp. gm002]